MDTPILMVYYHFSSIEWNSCKDYMMCRMKSECSCQVHFEGNMDFLTDSSQQNQTPLIYNLRVSGWSPCADLSLAGAV